MARISATTLSVSVALYMIDLNDRKALFSLAYIAAVAARAGYQIVEPRIDKDSVDGILMGDEGRRPRIEFQAKATARGILKATHVTYPLPLKNYDDLRADTIIPRLLVVVVMPQHEKAWLHHSERELRLRRCGYWFSLAGMLDVTNTTSVTMNMPRSQVFDSDQLAALMTRAEQGAPL
jgi:hypothetical protein